MKLSHVLLGLLAALTCSGLKAQTTIMTAHIPFEFQSRNKAMPAGDYQVEYSSGLVMLRCKADNRSVMLLTVRTARTGAPQTGLLEFKRYGDTYFFEGVWPANSPDGGRVPPTKKEKELASRLRPLQPTAVVLNGH